MTASKYLGQNRSKGIWQLVGLVYLVTIWPVVLAIGVIGGLVWMIIDVLKKVILNSGAANQTAAGIPAFGARLFEWPIKQFKWVFKGDGKFPFLP